VMTTSTGLRSYPPERRQCLFTTERHLRHFSVYTQQNCDSECYTNYTLKKCACVEYYMPREFKFLVKRSASRVLKPVVFNLGYAKRSYGVRKIKKMYISWQTLINNW
jgi:hypothetical protein